MPQQAEQEMSSAASPRICIVDDDAGIRETLRFLFEEFEYSVEEASDGHAALALLRSDPRPRVVLLDYMMSRLDGVATLRQLGDEPDIMRRTIVIFMTARNDPADSEIADVVRQNAFATIEKPYDLEALLAVVERATKHLAQREATA